MSIELPLSVSSSETKEPGDCPFDLHAALRDQGHDAPAVRR
jgi:hypothetical protein